MERAAAGTDPIARQTPAPLRDDALIRRQTIAFEERRVRDDPGDQITARMLSAQYLQRYRERGDVGDVVRAEAMARRSLRAQPQGNAVALEALSGALLALHRFRESRAVVREARELAPRDVSMAMQEASLDLELGDTASARRLIERFGGRGAEAGEVVTARLDEVSGHLADARRLLDRAMHRVEAIYEAPVERRAWFHVRLGEMAFTAGDLDEAVREERVAIERFPDDAKAWTDLGRFLAARGDGEGAIDAERRATALAPSAENLALLADAFDAGGQPERATQARDQIEVLALLGEQTRLADRLLATYDADRGSHAARAYAIARREIAVRDDVYAEDTLAWAAAHVGRWDEATEASRKALASGIEDSRIAYHAGVIAEHDGDIDSARRAYTRALALNGRFDPVFAPDARARLDRLRRDAPRQRAAAGASARAT